MLEFNLQFFADNGDKTEEPTAKKLSDARKEGQVAKSKEISNCLGLFVFFIVLRVMTGSIANKMITLFERSYSAIPSVTVYPSGEMPVRQMSVLFRNSLLSILAIVLPMMLIGYLVAFLGDLLQVKWQPTAKPLKPKLSKLDPVKGLKRLFSINSIVELIKSILKLAIVVPIVYSYIKDKTGIIYLLYDMPLLQAIKLVGTTIIDLGIRISAVYIVIAAADFGYQKWKFHKDMKMSKQEVKDEYKNAEGDPQVKGKIKRKMMEASRRRMMQKLPEADVVITNPTHYAVAIKYEPTERDAPYVIAKGEAYLAQKIKEVAKEHGVEIVENKPVARALYHNVEIGESVPPELYQAVAEILAFVYHLQGKI
ncbi:MAG: flagellar biosynthesis protein FlhB [Lachnospiraceae bacterium]|nr:flagellar biosynthesis protein FlhB [Lachnospiraceae bacterium]